MPKKKKNESKNEDNDQTPLLLEEQLDEIENDKLPISKQIWNGLKSLDNNKYFAGLCMIMLNIGSKYITIELSDTQQAYMKNNIMRIVLMFSITWIGTHDVIISIILTGAFMVMTQFLFNEQSRFYMIPKRFQPIMKQIDTNNDNVISEEELERAIGILQKAKTKSSQVKQNNQQRSVQNRALQQRTFIG